MTFRSWILPAIALGVGLIAGCSGGSPEGQSIRQAEKLTLYEGLPHPFSEAESFESARKSNHTIEQYGFLFYAGTLELKAEDEQKLKAILGSSWAYQPYSGEEKCGGFHPDFAVGWRVTGTDRQSLICFSCLELKLYTPAGEITYGIPNGSRDRLKSLLSVYRQNRPPFSHSER